MRRISSLLLRICMLSCKKDTEMDRVVCSDHRQQLNKPEYQMKKHFQEKLIAARKQEEERLRSELEERTRREESRKRWDEEESASHGVVSALRELGGGTGRAGAGEHCTRRMTPTLQAARLTDELLAALADADDVGTLAA
eukprot:TRINITY_DN1207_c0_g1_i1.p7 TRINITY_DN1207_c0_g1~~TRINITY_DN1207_c0_g1_i1.p7  ORF type:complete len:140 (-),score=28.62 TRINITY_DN1207_c0_g1_i1:307-726(-)